MNHYTAISIFFCAAIYVATSNAADIRTVGRVKVDLQPIHDWNEAKSDNSSKSNAPSLGERPLQHWKEISVSEYVSSMVNPVVVIYSKSGGSQQVLLQGCPQRLLDKLKQKSELSVKLDRASAASRYAAATAVEKEKRSSAHYSVSGNAAYVSSVANDKQRRQDEAAAAAAKQKLTKAEEEALEKQLQTLETEIRVEGKLLAMFIGKKYAGFEIWDTGLTGRW